MGHALLSLLRDKVFQGVFGEIMTVLIALEFNHTLQYVVTRQQSIIQTRVVLLIALLALARKSILLDLKETTPFLPSSWGWPRSRWPSGSATG